MVFAELGATHGPQGAQAYDLSFICLRRFYTTMRHLAASERDRSRPMSRHKPTFPLSREHKRVPLRAKLPACLQDGLGLRRQDHDLALATFGVRQVHAPPLQVHVLPPGPLCLTHAHAGEHQELQAEPDGAVLVFLQGG